MFFTAYFLCHSGLKLSDSYKAFVYCFIPIYLKYFIKLKSKSRFYAIFLLESPISLIFVKKKNEVCRSATIRGMRDVLSCYSI